jgi:cation transport ATPase
MNTNGFVNDIEFLGIDHPTAELIPFEEIEKQRKLHEDSKRKLTVSDDINDLDNKNS